MKNLTRSAVLLMLTACAQTPNRPSVAPAVVDAASSPNPPSSGVIAVRVPTGIAQFVLESRRNYDDAALGVQLRYKDPAGLRADVFIYPGPDLASNCAIPCARGHLATEVEDFHQSIPTMIERGYVQSATVTTTEALTPPQAAPWQLGHHLALAVIRDGRPQRSEFYVYYLPGFRVKVRSTFDETPGHSQAIDAFIQALMPALIEPGVPPERRDAAVGT